MAGRDVGVPVADYAGVPVGVAALRNTRLVLSARWPRVPPEGWVFPAASASTNASWAATPAGRTPLDDLREWREMIRRHSRLFGQPPAGG